MEKSLTLPWYEMIWEVRGCCQGDLETEFLLVKKS